MNENNFGLIFHLCLSFFPLYRSVRVALPALLLLVRIRVEAFPPVLRVLLFQDALGFLFLFPFAFSSAR